MGFPSGDWSNLKVLQCGEVSGHTVGRKRCSLFFDDLPDGAPAIILGNFKY